MGKKRRVVISGLGMATPLGLSVAESWDKALRGISGIGTLSYSQAGKSPVRSAEPVGKRSGQPSPTKLRGRGKSGRCSPSGRLKRRWKIQVSGPKRAPPNAVV